MIREAPTLFTLRPEAIYTEYAQPEYSAIYEAHYTKTGASPYSAYILEVLSDRQGQSG